MTALEQVLEVEKQAEKAIAEAKEKATNVVAEARKEKNAKLAGLEAEFIQREETQFAIQQKKIESAIQKVQTESDKRVEVLRKNFATKKDALVQKVKDTFLA